MKYTTHRQKPLKRLTNIILFFLGLAKKFSRYTISSLDILRLRSGRRLGTSRNRTRVPAYLAGFPACCGQASVREANVSRKPTYWSALNKRSVSANCFNSLLLASIFLIGCGTTKETIPEYIWPPPPEKPRFKLVNIIKGEDYFTISKSETFLKILAGESKENALMRPFGVAADATGTIYVTDISLKKVIIFDNQLKKLRSIGDKGNVKLHTPIGVVITPENRIIVTDSFLKQVFIYDQEGSLLKTIGGENIFTSPTGIAMEPKLRRLYIVDTNKHSVLVFDENGEYKFSIGERGDEDGQFNFPTNITIANEKVYVIDAFNGRIQIFDLNGKFLSKFGQFGTTPGHFSRPKGIALDSDSNIYVTDAAFDNFQIFNENGEPLMFIGAPGVNAGEFHLPTGIFIDPNNLIYVVDQLNARIQIFKYIGTN